MVENLYFKSQARTFYLEFGSKTAKLVCAGSKMYYQN